MSETGIILYELVNEMTLIINSRYGRVIRIKMLTQEISEVIVKRANKYYSGSLKKKHSLPEKWSVTLDAEKSLLIVSSYSQGKIAEYDLNNPDSLNPENIVMDMMLC